MARALKNHKSIDPFTTATACRPDRHTGDVVTVTSWAQVTCRSCLRHRPVQIARDAYVNGDPAYQSRGAKLLRGVVYDAIARSA